MTPRRDTTAPAPSDVLIAQLGLTRRTRAEVEDLYSDPLREHVAVVIPMAAGASMARAVAEPELDAA
jgi:hypothetical protein